MGFGLKLGLGRIVVGVGIRVGKELELKLGLERFGVGIKDRENLGWV